MVRGLILTAALVLLPVPVLAGCFAPEGSGLPVTVHFDDGHAVTVLRRAGDELDYSATVAGGHEVVNHTRLVLFPLGGSFDGKPVRYDWHDPLPDRAALTLGARYALSATYHPDVQTAQDYRLTGEAVRDDVVMVGGCRYPVRVFASHASVDGDAGVDVTVYLSLDLLVSLRTEIRIVATDTKIVYRVVGME